MRMTLPAGSLCVAAPAKADEDGSSRDHTLHSLKFEISNGKPVSLELSGISNVRSLVCSLGDTRLWREPIVGFFQY